jgi:hypothetical protein
MELNVKNQIFVLERTPLIQMFALEEDLVQEQTFVHAQLDTQEINAKHLFVLERTLLIQMFVLEEDLVNLLIIVIAQKVTLEINVK